MAGKTVFITGATSGIGKAIAEQLDLKGYNLIICGRRKKRLKQLTEKLGSSANVIALEFDVRDKDKVFQNISDLVITAI